MKFTDFRGSLCDKRVFAHCRRRRRLKPRFRTTSAVQNGGNGMFIATKSNVYFIQQSSNRRQTGCLTWRARDSSLDRTEPSASPSPWLSQQFSSFRHAHRRTSGWTRGRTRGRAAGRKSSGRRASRRTRRRAGRRAGRRVGRRTRGRRTGSRARGGARGRTRRLYLASRHDAACHLKRFRVVCRKMVAVPQVFDVFVHDEYGRCPVPVMGLDGRADDDERRGGDKCVSIHRWGATCPSRRAGRSGMKVISGDRNAAEITRTNDSVVDGDG